MDPIPHVIVPHREVPPESPVADPLVGTQEHTDSPGEARLAPEQEVALERPPVGRAQKSRAVATVLGLLLGGFGAHRFYLGYGAVGLAQLAVTAGAFAVALATALVMGSSWMDAVLVGAGVAALGMLWGVFEGISIAAGLLQRDAHGHPLRASAGG